MNAAMRQTALLLITALFGGGASHAAVAPPALPTPAIERPEAAFQSPVRFFRKLLARDAAGRAEALAARSSTARAAIEAKIAEYETLDARTRELRLRTTELRWFLKKLLPMEPKQRAEKLRLMSTNDRELVAVRLSQWDLLSPGWREEVLKHERTMDWLRQRELNPALRKDDGSAEPSLAEWRNLPTETRAGMLNNFDRFFLLSRQEQEKTLAELPEQRRGIVGPAIEKLQALPQSKRAECLDAFRQIVAMPAPRRERFFRKADQWRQMTRSERETWSNLVNKFPPMPPLPPGLVPKMPPLPEQAAEIIYPPLPPGLDLPTMPPLPLLTVK